MSSEQGASVSFDERHTEAHRIAAQIFLDFCAVAFNPLSYVPFWSPPKRKGPT